MFLSRSAIVLFAIFALSAVPDAQELPKAQLWSEGGNPQCEFLWAELDAFGHELSKNPASTGRIEIFGDSDDLPHVDFYWYNMVRGYGAWRKIDRSRWQVRRQPRTNERQVKFWLVPPGTPMPDVEEAEWSFKYPANTKPFIFSNGKNYSVEVGVCLDVDEIELLSKALDANPKANLNVVLITPTEKIYQRRKISTLRTLTKDYSIAKSRIQFFRKFGNPKRGYPDPEAEYWFVP